MLFHLQEEQLILEAPTGFANVEQAVLGAACLCSLVCSPRSTKRKTLAEDTWPQGLPRIQAC